MIKSAQKLKFHLKTFGCQMNMSDSERVTANLGALGFERTEEENEATLILFNTCSIRQKAEDKVYGVLKEWTKAAGLWWIMEP